MIRLRVVILFESISHCASLWVEVPLSLIGGITTSGVGILCEIQYPDNTKNVVLRS